MRELLPFLLIMQIISAVFVYMESKKLKMDNRMFWVIGVALFMPFFLPFYILIRPKRVIFACPNCRAENIYPTKRCRNCDIEFTADKIVPIRTQWGVADALMIIILSFMIIPIGLAGVAKSFGLVEDDLSSWGSLFGISLVGSASLLILSVWFVIAICKRSLSDIGLVKEKLLRNILIGIAVLIPAVFISYLVEEGTVNSLARMMPYHADELYQAQAQEHLDSAEIWPNETREVGKLLSAGFLMLILGPIAEEIMFRGIIYTSLRQKRRILPSLIFSALIFTFVHMQVIHFGEIFLMGILLAYLYERTRSLIAPIALHIAINLASVIALYYFPSLYT